MTKAAVIIHNITTLDGLKATLAITLFGVVVWAGAYSRIWEGAKPAGPSSYTITSTVAH